MRDAKGREAGAQHGTPEGLLQSWYCVVHEIASVAGSLAMTGAASLRATKWRGNLEERLR